MRCRPLHNILMRVRQLTAYIVRSPLKRPFSHASATRHESENVLVRCELVDGTMGWGEGVPRSYVTGETPAGCITQLRFGGADGRDLYINSVPSDGGESLRKGGAFTRRDSFLLRGRAPVAGLLIQPARFDLA